MGFGRWAQWGRAARVAAFAVLVSGCAGGLGSKAPPPTYDLYAANVFPGRGGGAARGQLIVSEPTALSILDTDKIMVRPTMGETAALSNAQWEDRLPKLIQARLVQSFENAHRLRAVGKPGDRLASDFLLVTDVRAFELAAQSRTAEVEISAKIVRERTGRIIAARVFRVSIAAEGGLEGAAGVAALNEAFTRVAREVVLWASRLV